MSKYEAVLFDFDGVIANTMPELTRLGRFTLQVYFDIPRFTALQAYRDTCGRPFSGQLQEIFPDHPRNPTAAEYFEERKDKLMLEAKPFDDVLSIFDDLRKLNIKTAICSSTRRTLIHEFLEKYNLNCDWEGSIEHGPKYQQIKSAGQLFDLDPNKMLFLGDSKHDGVVAEDAGVDFLEVTFDRKTIAGLIEYHVN